MLNIREIKRGSKTLHSLTLGLFFCVSWLGKTYVLYRILKNYFRLKQAFPYLLLKLLKDGSNILNRSSIKKNKLPFCVLFGSYANQVSQSIKISQNNWSHCKNKKCSLYWCPSFSVHKLCRVLYIKLLKV